jgi:hypothetical protein
MGGADAAPPPAISCSVEANRVDRKIRLRGKIISAVPASGNYQFEVEKNGPSGFSRVAQSGMFSIQTSEPAWAGEATFDFKRGTRVTVRLSGDALGRDFSCNLDKISDE